jgi:hypothetical protein
MTLGLGKDLTLMFIASLSSSCLFVDIIFEASILAVWNVAFDELVFVIVGINFMSTFVVPPMWAIELSVSLMPALRF